MNEKVILEPTIKGHCSYSNTETTPTDACQRFYECENCGALLTPKKVTAAYTALIALSPAHLFNKAYTAAQPNREHKRFKQVNQNDEGKRE